MRKQRGVIVGGNPSSGSTLLSLMLDSHPDLICGPELTIFSHPLLWDADKFNSTVAEKAYFSRDQLEGVLEWSCINLKALDYYHISKDELLGWLASSECLYEFGDKVFAKKMHEENATMWLEKTPQNLYAIEAFLRNNKKSLALVTIRDPRSVMSSLRRRGFSDDVVARICALEANIIHNLMTDSSISSRLHIVQYEYLIRDTINELEKICRFLGVSNKSELMAERSSTSRAHYDKSLDKSDKTASSAWRHSPLDKVSGKGLYSWKEELNANAYDLFIHSKVNAEEIRKYVRSENGSSSVLSADHLMRFFGYSIMPEEKVGASAFSAFYEKKVSFDFDATLSGASLNEVHACLKRAHSSDALSFSVFLKDALHRIIRLFKEKY